ncbi:MAG TPA: hypothetical protein PKJ53_01225 [Spirochaetales bacterium]|nr:hypothetical protein [Spirochaetales bacterium]
MSYQNAGRSVESQEQAQVAGAANGATSGLEGKSAAARRRWRANPTFGPEI